MLVMLGLFAVFAALIGGVTVQKCENGTCGRCNGSSRPATLDGIEQCVNPDAAQAAARTDVTTDGNDGTFDCEYRANQ